MILFLIEFYINVTFTISIVTFIDILKNKKSLYMKNTKYLILNYIPLINLFFLTYLIYRVFNEVSLLNERNK